VTTTARRRTRGNGRRQAGSLWETPGLFSCPGASLHAWACWFPKEGKMERAVVLAVSPRGCAVCLSRPRPSVCPAVPREQENEGGAAPGHAKRVSAPSARRRAGAAGEGRCAPALGRAGRTLQRGGGDGEKGCRLPFWWAARETGCLETAWRGSLSSGNKCSARCCPWEAEFSRHCFLFGSFLVTSSDVPGTWRRRVLSRKRTPKQEKRCISHPRCDRSLARISWVWGVCLC